MEIPAGRAAALAWRGLPAETRARAGMLSRTGHPHPDPAVQEIIVGYVRHLARRQRLWLLWVLVGLLVTLAPWQPSIADRWLDGLLRLCPFVPTLPAFGYFLVISARLIAWQTLGPPNLTAVARRMTAPGDVTLHRSRSWFGLLAVEAALPFGILAAPMLDSIDNLRAGRGDHANRAFDATVAIGIGTVLAVWLLLIVVVAVLLTGTRTSRALGRVDADGVHLHHLRLTVPWAQIRLVAALPGNPASFGIQLRDPALTLATSGLPAWRRRLLLRSTRQLGWLTISGHRVREPLHLLLAAAFARHRQAVPATADGQSSA